MSFKSSQECIDNASLRAEELYNGEVQECRKWDTIQGKAEFSKQRERDDAERGEKYERDQQAMLDKERLERERRMGGRRRGGKRRANSKKIKKRKNGKKKTRKRRKFKR